jgi:membrane protease YdiL (CAAX protease family)
MDSESDPHRWFFVLGIAFEAALGLLALGLGWLFGQPPLETFRWDLRDGVLGAAASLPLFATAVLAVRFQRRPWADIVRFFDEVIRPLFRGTGTLGLAAISLAAGVGEEMLFRGLLQPVLGRALGPWGGLCVASLLFGLMHPFSPAYFVLATLCGLYLGWCWQASGNLLTAVVTHALYDFLALVYLLRTDTAR